MPLFGHAQAQREPKGGSGQRAQLRWGGGLKFGDRRGGANLNFSFVCEASSFAENIRLGTKMRMPPCSSPPLAGTIVGRCAVVMLES